MRVSRPRLHLVLQLATFCLFGLRAPRPAWADTVVEITVTDAQFTPNAIEATAGVPLNIDLLNLGTRPHRIAVELGGPPIVMDPPVPPGGRQRLSFLPNTPGSYLFYDPAFRQRLTGQLIVAGAPTRTPAPVTVIAIPSPTTGPASPTRAPATASASPTVAPSSTFLPSPTVLPSVAASATHTATPLSSPTPHLIVVTPTALRPTAAPPTAVVILNPPTRLPPSPLPRLPVPTPPLPNTATAIPTLLVSATGVTLGVPAAAVTMVGETAGTLEPPPIAAPPSLRIGRGDAELVAVLLAILAAALAGLAWLVRSRTLRPPRPFEPTGAAPSPPSPPPDVYRSMQPSVRPPRSGADVPPPRRRPPDEPGASE